MDTKTITRDLERLDALKPGGLFGEDFLLTWDKTEEQIRGVLLAAELLRALREGNLRPASSTPAWRFRSSGTSPRAPASASLSAANLLGLAVQDLDETKSQIAHGETVRETANMLSFLTEAIGIRDDMYLGYGHTYMQEVAAAVREGYREGVLPAVPMVMNLQCDIDHPTQCLADLLHLARPLRQPGPAAGQADRHELGLLPVLRQASVRAPGRDRPADALRDGGGPGPPGRVQPDPEVDAEGRRVRPPRPAAASPHRSHGGGLRKAPTSCTPRAGRPSPSCSSRTELLKTGDTRGLETLEKECLENNRRFLDWECTEELMARTAQRAVPALPARGHHGRELRARAR